MIDKDEAYRHVQEVFRRGLVLIVGSGASCAQGLPGMGDLARHLKAEVPGRLVGLDKAIQGDWSLVIADLDAGKGLEDALDHVEAFGTLYDIITDEVSRLVGAAETLAISRLVTGGLPGMSKLLSHAARTNDRLDVITTNYDRIIEVCSSLAGLGVDALAYGYPVGQFNKQRSYHQMLKPIIPSGRRSLINFAHYPHVRLAKPHGSLDWYQLQDGCVSSALPLNVPARIIVPGGTKYAAGYQVPFDAHRERATGFLDSARAMLFYGYGFNDAHLQTHLFPEKSQPSVVVARTLTDAAKAYIQANHNALGVERVAGAAARSSRLVRYDGEVIVDGVDLSDIEEFNKEILGI